MFNHLKHLTPVYTRYLPYTWLLEKELRRPWKSPANRDYTLRGRHEHTIWNGVIVNANIILIGSCVRPFWQAKLVTRVTRHLIKRYPFYALSWYISHIVSAPPPPPGVLATWPTALLLIIHEGIIIYSWIWCIHSLHRGGGVTSIECCSTSAWKKRGMSFKGTLISIWNQRKNKWFKPQNRVRNI